MDNFVTTAPKKIGDILLDMGHITMPQLHDALEYQRQKKGRIGWILVALGYINRIQLYKCLAVHYGLEFRRDTTNIEREIDKSLLSNMKHEEVIEYQTLPCRKENDSIIVLTAYPNSSAAGSFIKERFKVSEIWQVVITDLDLTRITEALYRDEILDKSIYGLFYRKPEESAYSVFSKKQVIFSGMISLFVLHWIYFGVLSLLIFLNLVIQGFYTIAVLFKLIVSLSGVKSEIEKPVTDDEVKSLKDDEMPVYTVLVPVYKEPEVIGILMDALKKMDYPQNKLDIILLLEEDDRETFEAAKNNKPPGNWRFLIVPTCQPKTKPKACNYGLFFSRGKYLVIYDAEDVPEPDQLKKAVVVFKKGGKDYICYQGALNYFNKDENTLTKLFTLEYSYWYDYLLPGLDRLKLVIPLGGTSNHFDTEKLKKLGGWDPFNTTEDADLGVRAYAEGYKVGVVNATTFEEANSRLGNFIRQRSRWIKGYMQTFLVYSRHPVKLIRVVGFKGWVSFNLFIGGTPFVSLVNPITWSVFFVWLLTKTEIIEPIFPPEVLYLSMFNLLFGNFLGIYLNMVAVFKRKYYTLLPFAYLNPIYWFLQSIASYKSLYQLFSKPFYWEKTQHGITKHRFGNAA
ncbi:MAG: glycosyltransferase [Nitrospinae bacterium]|nr:glycosyltransferase [Nitrospinota bacterium]